MLNASPSRDDSQRDDLLGDHRIVVGGNEDAMRVPGALADPVKGPFREPCADSKAGNPLLRDGFLRVGRIAGQQHIAPAAGNHGAEQTVRMPGVLTSTTLPSPNTS